MEYSTLVSKVQEAPIKHQPHEHACVVLPYRSGRCVADSVRITQAQFFIHSSECHSRGHRASHGLCDTLR
ncbi:hypothetical protein E2C01_024959 [Portunus trituberculatus]|uniref:Uncharacterized protein n=1 Tax=Portunus trituberculatus TaxID=210409 RepID=A0A5B7EFA3_PORTR|nr:hypothetical protein [Portunus trituberculatus]